MKPEPHLSEGPHTEARPNTTVVDMKKSRDDLSFEPDQYMHQQHNRKYNQQEIQQQNLLHRNDPPSYLAVTMNIPPEPAIELVAERVRNGYQWSGTCLPCCQWTCQSCRWTCGLEGCGSCQWSWWECGLFWLLAFVIVAGGIAAVVTYFGHVAMHKP